MIRVGVYMTSRTNTLCMPAYRAACAAVAFARENFPCHMPDPVVNGYSAASCRNDAVRRFMETDCTHLMFIDHDIVVPRDAIARLAALEAPIATGCYPCMKIINGCEVPYITVFKGQDGAFSGGHVGESHLVDWHRTWFDGIRETELCGGGCLLIAREVLEVLGQPWFTWPADHSPDMRVSDDVDFCRRVRRLGRGFWPIKADGFIRCGHLKQQDIAARIVEEWERPPDVNWSKPVTAEDLEDGYAYDSHLPVLEAIGRSRTVRRVVEFGCGPGSTPFFLSPAFPGLERLDSAEHNPQWARWAAQEFAGEDRMHLWGCDRLEDMPSLAKKLDADSDGDVDLWFVDCDVDESGLYGTRTKIVEAILQTNKPALIVVHDWCSDRLHIAGLCVRSFESQLHVHEPRRGPCTAIIATGGIEISNPVVNGTTVRDCMKIMGGRRSTWSPLETVIKE